MTLGSALLVGLLRLLLAVLFHLVLGALLTTSEEAIPVYAVRQLPSVTIDGQRYFITAETDVLLGGRRCRLEDVPKGATINDATGDVKTGAVERVNFNRPKE
jgi:hypothetical protein